MPNCHPWATFDPAGNVSNSLKQDLYMLTEEERERRLYARNNGCARAL